MKIEWDFTELYDFADRLNDKSDFDVHMTKLTQQIAKALHHILLMKTPVDTGNLREMWNSSENLSFTVKRVSNGYQITLYNRATNNKSVTYPDFPYGFAVNYGHKTPGGGGWVMGKFFVENSIAETEEQLKTIIKHELQKWWSGVLNGK